MPNTSAGFCFSSVKLFCLPFKLCNQRLIHRLSSAVTMKTSCNVGRPMHGKPKRRFLGCDAAELLD